jgi:hypothetical protein
MCHVLQHLQPHDETVEAFHYRSAWSYTPLVLDCSDYTGNGEAPQTFNVIDKSNLLDHLGSLNLLAVCTPLLQCHPTSTLPTEILVPREANVAESAGKLLSGDFPTIALLLGLKPVQYWSNSTATWSLSDALLQALPDGDQIGAVLSHPVAIWKLIDTSSLQFDPTELAKLVINLYLEMFPDGSFAKKFDGLGSQDPATRQKQLSAYDQYTRGSLAAILKCLKRADVVVWTEFITRLVKGYILNDSTLNMGPHHFQLPCAHRHGLSLSTLDQFFDWWHPSTLAYDLKGPLTSWSNIPSTVCVTLVVPHSEINMFDDLNKHNGTPICEIFRKTFHN